MNTSRFRMFSLRMWMMPLLLCLVSAPMWLHVWEPQMFLVINAWCAPVADSVWTGLSLLGNGWGVLAVAAPLLLLSPRLLWAVLCAVPFTVVFARVGKSLIVSPRPAAEIDPAQFRVVGELLHVVSMPSGHTTTAVAMASAIVFAVAPAQRRRVGWLLLLALLVGVSRIAVGAHWPGDVAVGVALGLWSGMLGNVLLPSVPAAWFAPQHWAMRCVAALLGAAAYVLCTDPLDFAENRVLQDLLAAVVVLVLLLFALRTIRPVRTDA